MCAVICLLLDFSFHMAENPPTVHQHRQELRGRTFVPICVLISIR